MSARLWSWAADAAAITARTGRPYPRSEGQAHPAADVAMGIPAISGGAPGVDGRWPTDRRAK